MPVMGWPDEPSSAMPCDARAPVLGLQRQEPALSVGVEALERQARRLAVEHDAVRHGRVGDRGPAIGDGDRAGVGGRTAGEGQQLPVHDGRVQRQRGGEAVAVGDEHLLRAGGPVQVELDDQARGGVRVAVQRRDHDVRRLAGVGRVDGGGLRCGERAGNGGEQGHGRRRPQEEAHARDARRGWAFSWSKQSSGVPRCPHVTGRARQEHHDGPVRRPVAARARRHRAGPAGPGDGRRPGPLPAARGPRLAGRPGHRGGQDLPAAGDGGPHGALHAGGRSPGTS